MTHKRPHRHRLFPPFEFGIAFALFVLPNPTAFSQSLLNSDNSANRTSQEKTSEDRLGQLLVRLDLNQLRAAHVEKILARTSSDDIQRQLQTTLAELYVAQLQEFIEDRNEFSRVSKRLDELEAKVPTLASPKTLFHRFETSFRHGEYLLARYREDRRRINDLSDAGLVFREVAEKFDALQQWCNDRIKILDEAGDEESSRMSDIEVDNQLDLLSEISFKAAYYSGWSFFNTGISSGDSRLGQSYFRQGLVSFCQFLDIDPADNISDLDPVFLELSLPRNSQAFLGVALSYLAIGQNGDADDCFEMLAGPAGSDEIKSQIAFWQIQSLLEFGKVDDAALFANSYLSPEGGLNPRQQGQLALLAIRFVYARSKRTDKLENLGMLGFKTLAQLRQFQLTSKLIDDYKTVLPRPSFYSDWVTGQYLYSVAEKSGDAADYNAAANRLQLAVQQETEIPIIDVERCRNKLGWAYYKAGRYQKAADCFELVFGRIARLEPSVAASAAWLQHDCYLKQSDGKPRQVAHALKILEDLVSRFPESELAKKARLQIVKLRQTSLDPKEAIERLKEVVKTSPKDNVAKYELCLAYYRSFLEKVKSGAETLNEENALTESMQQIEPDFKRLSIPQRLKIILIKIDLAERNTALDVDIKSMFDNAFLLGKEVENTTLKAELRYRAYQFEKRRGNTSEMIRHMDWLIQNGDGSNYQAAVLVTRATQIEKELKNVDTAVERNQLYAEAIEVYKKLVNSNGIDVASIQSNNNARVAVSRLAQLMTLTGKKAEALGYLEILVAAAPTNAGYLRRYGVLLIEQKQYRKAVDIWRKLVSGLKKDSQPWYEAKYSVFKCLAETTPNQAIQPLKQFLVLYPDPPGDWKEKFMQLQTQLEIE